MASSIPPRPHHALNPTQQSLASHYRQTVHHVLTTSAAYTSSSSSSPSGSAPALPSIPGASPSEEPTTTTTPEAPLSGIFPFLAALPAAGRLSLDLLRTLNDEMIRLDFPADARETAALVSMSYFRAEFAVEAHVRIARAFGLLRGEVIEGLVEGNGGEVEGLNEGCEVAREVTRGLLMGGRVERGLWERAVRVFGGEEGAVLLVNFVALFVWTSFAANVCGAGVEGEGEEEEGGK